MNFSDFRYFLPKLFLISLLDMAYIAPSTEWPFPVLPFLALYMRRTFNGIRLSAKSISNIGFYCILHLMM